MLAPPLFSSARLIVHLDPFEGPLDLLLYLIQTNELNISLISLKKITDQYLEYVRWMQEEQWEAVGEFLVMASTLLQWKSHSLLPLNDLPEAVEEDTVALSPEQLLKNIQEHQLFIYAGEKLRHQPLLGQDVFIRASEVLPPQRILKKMDLTSLVHAYQEMVVRSRKKTYLLHKETVSISDKIKELASFCTLLISYDLFSFWPSSLSRDDQVATFLAVLELARLKKITVHQEGSFTSIFITWITPPQEGETLSLTSEWEKKS